MIRYSVIFLFFFGVLLIEHRAVAQEELSEAYLEQQDAIFEYKNANRDADKRIGNANATTGPATSKSRRKVSYLDVFIDLLTAIFQGSRE